MPKQKFRDEAGMYDIHVGWSHDGTVQVGVETADSTSIVDKLSTGGGDPASFSGLWGTLDRQGINALIHTLRRARNAAYGEDA